MRMQSNRTRAAAAAAAAAVAANPPGTEAAESLEPKSTYRAISDPREVTTLVMARMNLVNAKKDELAMAISGLVDITQQLTRTYGQQLLAIEQLRGRVKELEAPLTPLAPPRRFP